MENIENLIKKGNESFAMGMKTGHKFYYEESIEIYKKILEFIIISPILTNLGTAFNKIGKNKEAIVAYTKSLESKEYNCDRLKSITFFNRGVVNHSIGKTKKAIKDYENSILFDMNNYNPHNSLGAIKNEKKYYIEAIKKYKDALNLCNDQKMIKNIEKNIKNSEENIYIFLEIIGYEKLKTLSKRSKKFGQRYNLN